MSKRESVFVSEDEVIRQREYMSLIRDNSSGKVKNYSISTFGCQMNENDSERLSGMLSEMGYVFTENEEESDLIIYNTCCVRENAELKVYGHLGKLKNLKKNNPDLIIAVCGCMMQQEEVVEHIKSKFRHVNLVFGTHNLYKFPELLFNVVNSGERIYQIWDSVGEIAEGVPIDRKDGVKAWVTVMYGCNNFCSYCIVPYVRGRERSRRLEDIANEVKMLGRQGYREVTLLGQNVNSYGKDMENATNFASLLREVNMIEEIERIRFMTSHPKDLSDELIQAMRDCEKVCEHLHLPIQSGSTRVLRDMNRKYTKEQYLELVNKIRSNIPNLSITTDIIVGYPGETDEDFEETLDVIKKVRYDTAYTFLYSPRKGTPAEKNLNQVPDDIKKVRFDKLLEVQNAISKEINDTLIGSEIEVLVEGPSRNRLETYTGRTRTNKIVNFKGDKELTGKLVRVNIDRAQTWSLEGTII